MRDGVCVARLGWAHNTMVDGMVAGRVVAGKRFRSLALPALLKPWNPLQEPL